MTSRMNPAFLSLKAFSSEKLNLSSASPILRENKVWGVILADSQANRKEFTESNLIFLSFFSNLVTLVLDKIIMLEKLQDENRILKNRVESSVQIPDMIGESSPMRDLAKTIHRVAATDAIVVILGESGTGKDLVAQAIHKIKQPVRQTFPCPILRLYPGYSPRK